MTAPINRLELAYNQEQDRLVLILIAQDFSEYLFWITRRGTIVLWDILQKLLEVDKKTEIEHIRESQKWADKIQEEKSQKQPMADKLSTRVAKRPFGNEPLLLAKIGGRQGDNGSFQLRLEGIDQRWIEFGGDSTFLLALCQLILETVKMADWRLDLSLSGI